MMILQVLRERYGVLTESQRRLADYVAGHYRDVAFLTASQLASRLAVNEATVIRFAQRLGYTGYPEMVADVREAVARELAAPEPSSGEGVGFASLLASALAELSRLPGQVSEEEIARAASMLRRASRVWVLGEGLSAPLAEYLGLALQWQGRAAQCPPTDPDFLALMLSQAETHDLIVGVVVAGENLRVGRALAYARQRGASTLVIGCTPVAMAASEAETALLVVHPSVTTVAPRARVLLVLECLLQMLADEEAERVSALAVRVEEARACLGAEERP